MIMNNSNLSELINITEYLECNITNIWHYLACHLGAQQLPIEVAVPFTVLYVLIFVSGLLGNIAVCVVIIKHPSMHTATNYYLFNLAISDVMMLIFGIPYEITVYWHQYPWILGLGVCKIRALLSEMASYVSVLTIVAFSTERYLAICYPLYLYTMSGLQRALKIIACLWLIAFFSALPFSIYTKINYLQHPITNETIQESSVCAMLKEPEHYAISEMSFILFFMVPMCVIAVQYTKMALKISQRNRHQIGNNINNRRCSTKSQSHRAVIRMLAAVVIGFFVCWAPFHAQRLLYMHASKITYYEEINAWMFYITGIFYYISSTLNPILYNIMSNRYRIAFKDIFCGIRAQNNGALTRNSTLRETRQISHSESQRITETNPTYATQCSITENGNNGLRSPYSNELLALTNTKNGNTYIYEIALTRPKATIEKTFFKINRETCI